MKNEYEVRGDVTAIFIDSSKYGRKETLISTSKLYKLKELPISLNLSWREEVRSFYASCYFSNIKGNRKSVLLHRFLNNEPTGMQIDHLDHDTLNNTDENLRICSNAENQQNQKGPQRNNKSSGIRGVTWHKHKKKWMAQVRCNKKHIHVGYFERLEDAELAVIEARRKYMPFSRELTA